MIDPELNVLDCCSFITAEFAIGFILLVQAERRDCCNGRYVPDVITSCFVDRGKLSSFDARGADELRNIIQRVFLKTLDTFD